MNKQPDEMTEREWLNVVTTYALRGRWDYYHTTDSRKSKPGFPDLVLVRPPEIIIVELKAERGVVSAMQTYWLQSLQGCGIETHVWRPRQELDVAERLLRTHTT